MNGNEEYVGQLLGYYLSKIIWSKYYWTDKDPYSHVSWELHHIRRTIKKRSTFLLSRLSKSSHLKDSKSDSSEQRIELKKQIRRYIEKAEKIVGVINRQLGEEIVTMDDCYR